MIDDPKILVCNRDFPVSTLVHAIDNISDLPDGAMIDLVFPNYNCEGDSLYCSITAITTSQDRQYHLDSHGRPVEFYEIPADAIIEV